jgi:hypothetical protein
MAFDNDDIFRIPAQDLRHLPKILVCSGLEEVLTDTKKGCLGESDHEFIAPYLLNSCDRIQFGMQFAECCSGKHPLVPF